jgi:hypothetical protein
MRIIIFNFKKNNCFFIKDITNKYKKYPSFHDINKLLTLLDPNYFFNRFMILQDIKYQTILNNNINTSQLLPIQNKYEEHKTKICKFHFVLRYGAIISDDDFDIYFNKIIDLFTWIKNCIVLH